MKRPSTGYCPPEMAKVILKAGNDMEKLSEYQADNVYDLWSLGAVILYLLSGNLLWQMDQSDSITHSEDLKKLASDWPEGRSIQPNIYSLLPKNEQTADHTTGIDLS
jgi:serine/threonine protein kinase